MAIRFSTKARTLASLQTELKSAKVLPLRWFSVSRWHNDSESCVAELADFLQGSLAIVRSSCLREDRHGFSNAGAFLSLPNVPVAGIKDAIDKVISSYGEVAFDDEVLVQPMLESVVLSGVAFTHDPNTCSPYMVINWSEGGDTSKVTGGFGGRVWYQSSSAVAPPLFPCASVVHLLNELLVLFDGAPVDCEFAVTRQASGEQLWLLQARPLALASLPETAAVQYERLKKIEGKINRGMQPHPFLMGRRTVYGVMPDWNPAEIIGIRPKPLSLSLYRDLVTDSIWAYQRHNYGYRNLRSFPLMPHFFGLPYVDVRLSFNSFIPADLEEGLAGRLVDYYIDRLLAEPNLHDKVEFEIVFSCYTLDLPERIQRLAESGFSQRERDGISASLRSLTNRILHPDHGLWKSDAKKLDTLNARREELLLSSADPLERIYWLLEDAKRYGTLPFAGLARAGFIAVQMLRSLVAVGVFSESDYDAFISGVSTVSGQLSRDRATLDKATFLARYGHLRPGTYDILSYRYDEAPDVYFDWAVRPEVPDPITPFSLTLPQMREIARLSTLHGLEADPVGLFDFMQAGIELRELAKFHFTRNLSDALSLIVEVGAKYGFSREEMAYCDVSVFKELHIAARDHKDLIRRSIDQGRAQYNETLKLSLPPLISHPNDVWSFGYPEASPNYVTQKQVTAPVVSCEERDRLKGAIVCIPNADPGFDWLFAHQISGLVTAWGGANSHMAIRAGELSLPAVIGAGELLYRKWSTAKKLFVDCAGRRVEVLG